MWSMEHPHPGPNGKGTESRQERLKPPPKVEVPALADRRSCVDSGRLVQTLSPSNNEGAGVSHFTRGGLSLENENERERTVGHRRGTRHGVRHD